MMYDNQNDNRGFIDPRDFCCRCAQPLIWVDPREPRLRRIVKEEKQAQSNGSERAGTLSPSRTSCNRRSARKNRIRTFLRTV